jgi:hypothetical protein
MGKGSGGCISRSAFSFAAEERSAAIADVPGRSGRARETFLLLQRAGSFPNEYLLRNVHNPAQPHRPEDVDAQDAAHNALMHWVPSSYHGHGGYVPEHEQLRQEIMYGIMLDGDRRAHHRYFYQDRQMNAVWTLGSAAAVRGWYRLPHLGNGDIAAEGLSEAIRAGMHHPQGGFLASLRTQPIATLGMCTDIHEPETGIQYLSPRLAVTSATCQQAVLRAIQADTTVPAAPIRHLKIKTALDIADREGLPTQERDWLVEAAALAPVWGTSTLAAQRSASCPQVAALLEELAPQQSNDRYCILTPTTSAGARLADVQQAWMGSEWCDWGITEWQAANNLPDNVATLEEIYTTIPRTPWHTKYGREQFGKRAKQQETRLRSLIALARGGTKIPAAPKGWKQLTTG